MAVVKTKKNRKTTSTAFCCNLPSAVDKPHATDMDIACRCRCTTPPPRMSAAQLTDSRLEAGLLGVPGRAVNTIRKAFGETVDLKPPNKRRCSSCMLDNVFSRNMNVAKFEELTNINIPMSPAACKLVRFEHKLKKARRIAKYLDKQVKFLKRNYIGLHRTVQKQFNQANTDNTNDKDNTSESSVHGTMESTTDHAATTKVEESETVNTKRKNIKKCTQPHVEVTVISQWKEAEDAISALSKEITINTQPKNEFTINAHPNEFTINTQADDFTIKTQADKFTINTEPNEFTINTQADKFTINTQPNEVTSNTQPNEFTRNTHPNEFTINTHPNEFTINTQPNEFIINTQPNEFTSNTEPNEFTGNTQLNEFTINTQPNEFTLNTQPNELTSNTQPNEFASNTQPNEFASNTQHSEFTSNTQPNELTSNTQPNEFASNTQPNEFASNTQHNEFTSNTQPNELTSNTQPNELTSNTQPNEFTSKNHPNEFAINTQANEFTINTQLSEVTNDTDPNKFTINTHTNEFTVNAQLTELTMSTQPDEFTVNTRPNEFTSNTQPNEDTSNTQPNEFTSDTQPSEFTINTQLNEVTINTQPNEVTINIQPKEEVTITIQPNEDVTITTPLGELVRIITPVISKIVVEVQPVGTGTEQKSELHRTRSSHSESMGEVQHGFQTENEGPEQKVWLNNHTRAAEDVLADNQIKENIQNIKNELELLLINRIMRDVVDDMHRCVSKRERHIARQVTPTTQLPSKSASLQSSPLSPVKAPTFPPRLPTPGLTRSHKPAPTSRYETRGMNGINNFWSKPSSCLLSGRVAKRLKYPSKVDLYTEISDSIMSRKEAALSRGRALQIMCACRSLSAITTSVLNNSEQPSHRPPAHSQPISIKDMQACLDLKRPKNSTRVHQVRATSGVRSINSIFHERGQKQRTGTSRLDGFYICRNRMLHSMDKLYDIQKLPNIRQ